MEPLRRNFGFPIKVFSLAAGPFLVKFLPIKLQKMGKTKIAFVIIFGRVLCIMNKRGWGECSNEKFLLKQFIKEKAFVYPIRASSSIFLSFRIQLFVIFCGFALSH